MRLKPFFIFPLIILAYSVNAQVDSSRMRRIPSDTGRIKMNMDAVYNRPFLQYGKSPVAIGGYVEANTQYVQTEGVTEGLSFQMRRFTLFLSSSIHRKIRFLSELEFEDGTKEINIEFAAIDVEFHPLLNLRGGVIMNPIGAFNQNHDGPRWEFVDRPLSATQLLPATWSNVGFGLHGKWYHHDWVIAYEGYLTNGFDDTIISNGENKTFLPATKLNRDRFEESNNGIPLTTTKFAVRHRKVGELGISHMGGVYNKFQEDGLQIDTKRRVDAFAVDFNTTINSSSTYITGEWTWVMVQVPGTYIQQFGSRQQGGFVDLVQPFFRKTFLGFERSVFNAAVRLDYVDWNADKLNETGQDIGDDVVAIVPGLSWRPTGQTVIRLNYRYQWQRDFLNNPAIRSAGIQIGISSYF